MKGKAYTKDGVKFNSVKVPLILFRDGPIGIVPATDGTNAEAAKGILYTTNEIQLAVPFINAVDIDWNEIEISRGNYIRTTADLINWIKGNNVNSEVIDLLEETPSENRSIIIYNDDNWNYEVLKDLLIEVTYDELVILKNLKKLDPGRQYRIIDYVTKVKEDESYISAEHLFDIIVTADSKNTLNENARAINHLGFTYFINNNLSAWKIKYSLNNDLSKYEWASPNGKGVIYYLKDEFNNEAYYDFKNILFNTYYTFNYTSSTPEDGSSDSSSNSSSDSSGSEDNTSSGEEHIDNRNINLRASTSINKDASLSSKCHDNSIGISRISYGKQRLNHNVIIDAKESCDIVMEDNCEYITIPKGSHILIRGKNRYITFTNTCYNVCVSLTINTGSTGLELNPRNTNIYAPWSIIGKNTDSEIVRIRITDLYSSLQSLKDSVSALENADPIDLTPIFENNPLSLLLKNGTNEISLITLQVDSNNKISDLNNFAQTLTLNVNQDGLLLSDNTKVSSLTLTLFGQQYDLLNYTDYSQLGIYLSGVTSHPTNAQYTLTFAFRGGPKTITSSSLSVHVSVLDNSTTHNFSKTIPIVPLTSVRGADAELYLLYKYLELLEVNSSGHLQCTLRYGLMHIVGTSVDIVAPTYQVLKVKFFNYEGTQIGSQETIDWDPNNNYWEYININEDWYTDVVENQIYYAIVELLDNEENVLENSVVNVELLSTGFLSVTNGLMLSVQALEDNYSSIVQKADSINLAVVNMSKFNVGEFPDNTEYEQYAYYCNNSDTPPTEPEGDVPENLSNELVYNLWTLGHLIATEDYKYVWYSKRTKPTNSPTHAIDPWSTWNIPLIFQMYGNPRGYVNSATLQMKADEITSTVSENYLTIEGANTTNTRLESQIRQLPESILSTVTAEYVSKADANSTYVTQSSILQLPESISAQVKTNIEGQLSATGIDIELGKITLTADNTDIQGNLKIHNANEGIVICDNNLDTPRIAILADSIGQFLNRTMETLIQMHRSETLGGSTLQFSRIALGDMGAGSLIKLYKIALNTGLASTVLTSASYSIDIKRENISALGSPYTGQMYSVLTANGEGRMFLASFDKLFEVINAGKYYIEVTFIISPEVEPEKFTMDGTCFTSINTLSKVAMDGAFFASGLNRLAWFGTDCLKLAWDDSFLTCSSSGILYGPDSSFKSGELGSMMRIKVLDDTTGGTQILSVLLTEKDGAIVIKNVHPYNLTPNPYNNNEWIYCFSVKLAPTPPTGKYYFIKNKTSLSNVYVFPNDTGAHILTKNNNLLLEYIQLAAAASICIMYDGTDWIIL